MDIAPDDFPTFVVQLPEKGFVGGNVTIPHKETAFALVARHDEAAELIGAVNTLWLRDGVIHGGNTDAYGFAANLDEQVVLLGQKPSRGGSGRRRRRARGVLRFAATGFPGHSHRQSYGRAGDGALATAFEAASPGMAGKRFPICSAMPICW